MSFPKNLAVLLVVMLVGCSQPDLPSTTASKNQSQPVDEPETDQAWNESSGSSANESNGTADGGNPSSDKASLESATSDEDGDVAESDPAPELDDAPPSFREVLESVREDAAAENWDQAIESIKTFLTTDEKHRGALLAIGQLLQRKAMKAADDGDKDTAHATYIASASYFRQLRDAYPDLRPTEKSMLAQASYNEACAYAVSGKRDQALAAIKEAIDNGFDDTQDLFASDADLSSIRETDEFKGMMKVYAEKAAALIAEQVKEIFASNEPFEFAFDLPDTDGNQISSESLKGKVAIVDIWGTWCPPCRMEIPHFVMLHQKFKEAGLEIVGINYENEEGEEAIKKIKDFAKENGMTYACVIGDEATQGRIPNLEGFPTTIFLDREGKVRAKIVGYHKYAILESIVKELLGTSTGVTATKSVTNAGA